MLPSGKICWGQSASKYVQEAVRNLENWLKEQNNKLPTRCDTPMSTSYWPELDTLEQLDAEMTNYYQSAIGVLRWAIELGHIDTTTEVSMLVSQMALPRVGHFNTVLRIFAYLKSKHNSRIVFDPTTPQITEGTFKRHTWVNFYGDILEALPRNAPTPKGLMVRLIVYVDADHTADRLTRQLRTGYIIYIQNAPIVWFSKKQGSIEAASFGSEFLAMKACAEPIVGYDTSCV